MGKPSAPRPPDPYQTAMGDFGFNNPTQITPYGTLTNTPPQFSGTGRNRTLTGMGTSTLTLNPDVQNLLDQQIDVSGISLAEALRRQPELSNLPSLPQTDPALYRDTYFQQQRGLLDPVFSEQERSMRDRLANEGLPQTSEAYGYDQGQFMEQRNRSYERAAQDAIMQAPGLAAQEFQLGAARRQVPFNEIASLLGLQQTQIPTLQNFYQPRGADFMGAQALSTQAQQQSYQQKAGMFNNLLSGLFQLGSAGISRGG